MKSPIFQIIRDYLVKEEGFKSKCFLKVTKKTGNEGKNFYKILLSKTREPLNILGTQWNLVEHHLSVYEEQSWSEKNYLSTYHYTATFNANEKQIITHTYFDHNGEYCNYHIKDKKNVLLSIKKEDEAALQSYAETASIQIISKICIQANCIADKFEKNLRIAMDKMHAASLQLHNENKKSLQVYLKHVDKCLNELENLRRYSYNPHKGIHQILTLTKERIQSKLTAITQEEKRNSNKSFEPVNKEKESRNLNSIDDKQPEKVTPKKLEKQPTELLELEKIIDNADKLVATYNLLEKRFKLYKDEDINLMVDDSKKYYDTLTAMASELNVRAKKGDFAAVKKLAPFVEELPPSCYFLCVKNGHVEIVNFLIKKFKFNINQICHFNIEGILAADTLLLTAVRENQEAMVKLLLELKANPNIRNPMMGATPLIEATCSKQLTIMNLLLKANADPNIKWIRDSFLLVVSDRSAANLIQNFCKEKDNEYTAIHVACEQQSTAMVKLLLEHGADCTIKDASSCTPFLRSTAREDKTLVKEIVKMLLAKGAKIEDQHPTYKYTPLLYACQMGRFEDVKCLIENGADPNFPCMTLNSVLPTNCPDLDQYFLGPKPISMTPLMKTAQKGHIAILDYLLNQPHKELLNANIYNAHLLATLAHQFECAALIKNKFPQSFDLIISIFAEDEARPACK